MYKRTLNNSNFFDDTPIVACSLQIKVLTIQTPSFVVVTPLRNSMIKMINQVDRTQFIITNHVRCSTKYLGALSVYSTINQVDRTQLVSFVYPNYAMTWMTTVTREICYLLSTALVFPEEEGMMQQSSVSISIGF